MKPQPGDRARVWPGNTFPEISGLESGPAVRTGPLGSDVDWRNGHPDRVNLRSDIEQDMNSLSDWFCANKLSLNVSKTNFLLINTKQTHQAGDFS